jgi:DNA polymerase V
VPEAGQQLDIFGFTKQDTKSQVLMATMDKINRKYDKHTIKLASEGTNKTWVMKRDLKSPNYTTDWHDLPNTVK